MCSCVLKHVSGCIIQNYIFEDCPTLCCKKWPTKPKYWNDTIILLIIFNTNMLMK
jgi:hypothetical protein